MNRPHGRRATALVAGVGTAFAGALVAPVLVAAPASADAAAPVLAWSVSERVATHLSTHTLDDGATETEGVVSFPLVESVLDAGTGATTLTYDGSLKAAFAFGGTEYYSITLADPVVEVDDAGAGSVSAVVSAANAATGQGPAAETTPARVVVTEFSGGTWTDGPGLSTLAATPDWAGVLPAGSDEALALGLAEDRPVDGQSFAPSFLEQLTSGVRAHFYASGSSSDAAKAPTAFVAERATTPEASAEVVTQTDELLQVDVAGEGFNGQTNPGDNGVYVGIAPAGGLPPVDTREGQDAFAASAWVSADAMSDGSFAVTLNADPSDPDVPLDPSEDYAVYTWQAHTHSNTTQDTETPIALDWVLLGKAKAASTTEASIKKAPKVKRKGKVKVVVSGDYGKAEGTAHVVAKKAKKTKKVARTVTNGRAVVTLPKLAKGRWNLVVTFKNSETYKISKDRLKVRVR